MCKRMNEKTHWWKSYKLNLRAEQEKNLQNIKLQRNLWCIHTRNITSEKALSVSAGGV